MGIRGYVQKTHAVHGFDHCVSGYAQASAAGFLARRGITIACGECEDPAVADTWEIEFDQRKRNGKWEASPHRIESAVRYLRKHPDCVVGDDGTEGGYGESLADLLEDGLEAAKTHGYNNIIIDWW